MAPILTALRGLQDLLGELHDAHVLERELASAVEAAARERARRRLAGALAQDAGDGDPAVPAEAAPEESLEAVAEPASEPEAEEDSGADPVDGLLVLARRNRRRRQGLFAELAAGWLGDEAPQRGALTAAVRDLARWLEAGFSPPPPASAGSAPTTAP